MGELTLRFRGRDWCLSQQSLIKTQSVVDAFFIVKNDQGFLFLFLMGIIVLLLVVVLVVLRITIVVVSLITISRFFLLKVWMGLVFLIRDFFYSSGVLGWTRGRV